jgi:hypothetical protein
MSERWKLMNTAPKDGTWILLRGRNSIGELMVPVVAAWCPPAAKSHGWADSGSLRNFDALASDPRADWCAIPE